MTSVSEYTYPQELANQLQPLPPAVQATSAYQKLIEAGFTPMLGLTEALIGQLSVRSLEPAILEYCPEDSSRRFIDIESVRHWQTRGRLPLVLMQGDQLAGIGWMGVKESPLVPGGKITFAIRLYELAAGKRLSSSFMKVIMTTHQVITGADSRACWGEVWDDNVRALAAYEHIGFREVARLPATPDSSRPFGRVVIRCDAAMPSE